MRLDARVELPAVIVIAGCIAVVLLGVARAPAREPKRAATADERAEIANEIAKSEAEWVSEVVKNFPRDNWSQSDDFHGREFRKLTDLARERGIRIEDALRAVDDELHTRSAVHPDAPDDRHARAVPCKPRPFYD